MRIAFYSRLLFWVWVSIASAYSQNSEIRYSIKPVPAADRTVLQVKARFGGDGSASQVIRLPADAFGTPDIHKYVTSFEGIDGTRITNGQNAAERIVHPDRGGNISISYVVSYDPVEMDKYPYAPNTAGNYFHLAGCQWLLRIGDEKIARPISVEISGAPKTWRLYSSIAESSQRFETISSYSDLTASVIGGGDHSYFFRVKDKPVSVFVHGKFNIPNEDIYSAVERIVRVERDWFADYEQPFYHVVVAPRSGVTAGYAPKNAFINFVRKDISRDELNLLLAHEMFHFWLPNKIKIVQDEKYASFRYEWFFEGFTDYFAPRILLEAGLLSTEGFAELMNKAILNIADNPHRAETYDDFVNASNAKRFNSLYKKLSYHRGALIALNWNTLLLHSREKKDLADFIRDLFQIATRKGGRLYESEFFDFAADYGLDGKGDMERYITRGEGIELDPRARIRNIGLRQTEMHLFDPGFSLEETRRTGKIAGVVEGGNAYKAGLRNGMDFINAVNANRTSNQWRYDQPLQIIAKINGTEQRFEFYPRGKKELRMLFKVP